MNAKILIVSALVVALCFVTARAVPVLQEEELVSENDEPLIELYEPFNVEETLRGPRYRRVTCDLLSATIKGTSLNHAACAAHCIAQRYRGGYCNNGVCHCRN